MAPQGAGAWVFALLFLVLPWIVIGVSVAALGADLLLIVAMLTLFAVGVLFAAAAALAS
jgi:hypothetical protein